MYITDMHGLAAVSVHMRDVLLNKFNRAKLEKDDVAPQSKYVDVFHFGLCHWTPFFSWSVSHCSIDTTWFPFDEQSCSLIYNSWKYHYHEVKFSYYAGDEYVRNYGHSPNAVWDIVGKRLLCTTCMYSIGVSVMYAYTAVTDSHVRCLRC